MTSGRWPRAARRGAPSLPSVLPAVLLPVLVAVLLVAILGGCGDERPRSRDESTADADPTDPTDATDATDATDCATDSGTPAVPGATAYDRFVVGFRPGSDLAGDPAARAELLAEVGERLCLELVEVGQTSASGIVVRSERPLDARGQARVVAALQRHVDVRYAGPDVVVPVPEQPSAQ